MLTKNKDNIINLMIYMYIQTLLLFQIQMVTIKTVNNPVDAHLLKVKLESEGIRCELRYIASGEDQDTSSTAIELHVLSGDIEQANNLIEESSSLRFNETHSICPQCNTANSLSTKDTDKHLRLFIEALFTLSTMNYQKTEPKTGSIGCTCKHCGLSYAPNKLEK